MIEMRHSGSGKRARVVDEYFSQVADEYCTKVLTGWLSLEKAKDKAVRLGARQCERCDNLAAVRCNSAGQHLRWDAMNFCTDHCFCADCYDGYMTHKDLRNKLFALHAYHPDIYQQAVLSTVSANLKHMDTWLIEYILDQAIKLLDHQKGAVIDDKA